MKNGISRRFAGGRLPGGDPPATNEGLTPARPVPAELRASSAEGDH